MRSKRIFVRCGAWSVLALLLLLPRQASAQTLSPGWYKVESEGLFVRNHNTSKLVMGTLRQQSDDKFYVVSQRAGSNYAWGYARGAIFKGCGWVGVRYKTPDGVKSALSPSSTTLPAPTQCGAPKKIDERNFAWRFAPQQYLNLTPPGGRGSNARVRSTTGTAPEVYGNYVNGRPYTVMGWLLPDNKLVYWRYFTPDRRFVMVGLSAKKMEGKYAPGRWGFVRCTELRPSYERGKDYRRFLDTCLP